MTVAQLKMMLEKKFKVAPEAQSLSFRSDTRALPIALDDESAEIGSMGVHDGGQILVHEMFSDPSK